MIIPIFVWQSPKGHCYGNQLNLGDIRRHRQLLFALAFNNGLADRTAAFKILNGNKPTTSCTNSVNVCLIILEFMLLKCAILAAIRPQFDDNLHLSPWRSEIDWKIAVLISAE